MTLIRNSLTLLLVYSAVFMLPSVNSRDLGYFKMSPYYQVPTLPPRSATTPKRTLNCVCDDTPGDELLCASNGVTYKSSCRFQCAKKRVPRLRIVQNGPCGQMTRQQYWSSKGNKNN